MDQGLLPRRYAKAFYEFACEKDYSTRAYELMQCLAQTFANNTALNQVMANPYVSSDEKIKLLRTASGANDTDTPLDDLFKLLVKNGRIDQARGIALAYNEIYRKMNNICDVHVESAAPLTPADTERIKHMIERHLKGATIEYTFTVNPELIGGFVVTVDSQRLDASVKNELDQLRLNLLK